MDRGGNAGPDERLLAVTEWLLAAAVHPPQARSQWETTGAAWLLPRKRFTAVTIPADRMGTAVVGAPPRERGAPLGHALEGLVFYQDRVYRRQGAYTVLLPGTAEQPWRVRGTTVHPPRAYLLVPAPDRTVPAGDGPWWVLPPQVPGRRCTPAALASLLSPSLGLNLGDVHA
ncbi:hypothetical protein VSR01_16075 [Actinacidiphila sp. DG2A-62]|uniref:hypothetical protein n=1 Tax=Actinacidiphila sp. DG2A-62 TaxID=3108821 RepID=UPI002DBAE3DF|nr:hypothetical protein [Actinacidiphila sp. DG2A-62]MEC3994962.1 hypothetical protein [Actinacidiphila sp. DG2A-62]